MEAGAIVEQGTHDELLAARGTYWRLYNAQFDAPATDHGSEEPGDASAGAGERSTRV